MSRCIACDHDLVGGNCPIHGDLTARAEQAGAIRLYQDENGDYHRGIAIEAAASVPTPEQDEAVRRCETHWRRQAELSDGVTAATFLHCADELRDALATPPPVPAAPPDEALRIAFEAGRRAASFEEAMAQVQAVMESDTTGMAESIRAFAGAVPAAPPLDDLLYRVANALTNALYLRSMTVTDAEPIEASFRSLIEEVEYARLRPDQEDGDATE